MQIDDDKRTHPLVYVIIFILFVDAKGTRRTFPLGGDFNVAKKLLTELENKNRQGHDFENEKKLKTLSRIKTSPAKADVLTLHNLIGEQEFEFDGEMVHKARRPIVYAWIRDDEVFYVGQSAMGVFRLFDPGHQRLSGIGKNDRILVWTMPSTVDALNLESHLIEKLHPRYNSRNGHKIVATARI